MNVSQDVIAAAAQLLCDAASNAPIDDEIDHRRLDETDSDALEQILDDLEPNDFHEMLRLVAARLPEPDDAAESGLKLAADPDGDR